MALLYSYKPIQTSDKYYTAYRGPQRDLWNEMINLYGDKDDTNDLYLKIGNDRYERIDPAKLTPGTAGLWATYDDNNGTRILLSHDNLFWRNPLTPTAAGSAFRLNSNTPPATTSNDNAYSYNEWKSGNLAGLQALSNIYGDIDTADEFTIINNLGLEGVDALNYINDNYVDARGNKKSLFANGKFIGTDDELKKAASLLNQYLTSEAAGKEFATQLRRGLATLPMLDRYKAYAATKNKEWGDDLDRAYLNEARNSIDKKYNGANFFKKYAGDKVWGTLANEFAQNDYFRNDYVVDALHVMDRLNRDAGNGRKLIEIYNDIINNSKDSSGKDLLTPEQRYRIFRDMTRRRFKLNNDFWNRAENGRANLKGIRDKVYRSEDVLFKQGGQIFNMLFV